MKFLTSSTTLANKLSTMAKVMSTKAVRPILSSFLFELDGEILRITASDGESIHNSTLAVANIEGTGKICVPADRLLDALKNLPEQPIGFTINETTFEVNIKYNNGKYNFVANSADEYTIPSSLNNIETQVQFEASTLNMAITQSLFAVANDDLRPIMNGIYFTTADGVFQCAASDGQKLIRNTYKLENPVENLNFVLPSKAAILIKNITNKTTAPVTITTIERKSLLSTINRVGLFSSAANGSIEMNFSGVSIDVSGKDIDYSTSAKETLFCSYSGTNLRIGFKYELLKQILENATSKEITFSMGDCSKAVIIKPVGEDDKIDNLSLLVPMMLDA